MAKLVTNTNTALMGTGMNVLAKLVPVAEIKTIPELSEIFSRQDKVVEDIKKSIQEDGFHKEEPIVIAKLSDGTVLGVADGNTRLMVAKEIGLDEVPVVYKTFNDLDDAIQYAKDRQFHRRNLSQAEIYAYANNLDAVEDRNGEGRATERLAEELGVSASTIEHARTVENRADEETKEKIKNNKMSINQAYQKVRKSKSKQEKESNDESDSIDFDDDISDALEDNEGNPQSVTVRSRDMSEHFTPPQEDEFDKRLIERYKDGFADGIKKGFSEGAYQIYDKIISMLHEGKAVEEIENDALFSDFTFSEIAPKFEITTDDEELLKTYNK
ncbi:ParB N-terminal domain-containing protein [uncultured Treponema sp.]|uniref:ParB/RepB/Spo0J family partition protein n=1 Tax=uncultured Treponema sp. TaxID=162155 RepID=UPI00259ACCA5|nr:ParB N-terminal domain-containing protein [uncultured Treponema sp.]